MGADDSDNTLSEMPSIHHDKTVTPGLARQKSNLQKKIRVIPYHKKYPLPENTTASDLGRLSPGEVPRHIRSLHIQGGNNKTVLGLTTLSQGVRTKSIARIKTDNIIDHDVPQSPEAINVLRDGIDVINISGTKQKLKHVSAMDDVLLVDPHTATSTSRLQIVAVKSYEESESPHLETAPTVASNKEAGISDSSLSPKTNPVERSKGVTLKPLTIVIPSVAKDVNPTYGESAGSASENIDISYSDDFDFSSISIPT